ncbi:MAG: DUF1501 domain-containing protein [Planctomycetaceae bacterium]|nr:DUF1501 domain-containing protein [Planctomycetaceae bacterium]
MSLSGPSLPGSCLLINIGRIRTRECHGVGRRALLHAGSLSALGFSLPQLLALEDAGRRAGITESPRAKSVILLWLWGGPSHIDTFDMKPEAPVEYRGPYRPVDTAVPGLQICELLPQLAKRADRYSVIRSLHCSSNDHGIAGTIGLTGSDRGATSLGGQVLPGRLEPTHGSIVSRVMGLSAGTPRFVAIGDALHQGHRTISGEGGGKLGPIYDPFQVNYIPSQGVRIPNLELADDLQPSRIENRRALLTGIDSLARQYEHAASVKRIDSFYEQAFSMLTSNESRDMFQLDPEPETLRRRYGRFRFGQCCLMARRLVEAGVRFVQVNWSAHVEPVEDTGDGGWDMHDRYFQQYQDRHSWMLDQAASALLDDLEQRGLLSETIVVAVGEFGRTPKINAKSGRDHWNQCYSAIVAGGGLRTGQIIGASDERAEHPILMPLTPADLFTTVLQQIGITTPRLTDVGLAPLGEAIEALM